MHCGHYHKLSEHASTAFEFTNCAPQCYQCNRHFSGRPDVMREWIIKKFGKEEIERLDIKRHNLCKIDAFLLKIYSDHFKNKLNELSKIKGNPWKI
jgi:hypothetical protein